MSSNVKGFEYEDEVIASLVAAGISGNITEGAGASSADADADMNIFGTNFLVEVKKDGDAQMGGTSVRYVGGEFEPVGAAIDEDTFEVITAALSDKKEHIERLLSFLGGESFPISCEKDAWTTAQVAGLLKPINVKVKKDTEFLAEHYASKGVDYIQIGGAGLFYLRDNPAGLPVPKLEGEINIELRAGRSGSRKTSTGVSMVGGSLRAQGRLCFSGESPYTLDNPESINKMMEHIK